MKKNLKPNLTCSATLDEDEVVVSNAFVHHLLCCAHITGIKGFITFIRCHREEHLPTMTCDKGGGALMDLHKSWPTPKIMMNCDLTLPTYDVHLKSKISKIISKNLRHS